MSKPFDFNNAEKQQNYDVIPEGTIVPVSLTLRPGGQGENGWLKASNSSDAMMLDAEFVILEGKYAKRKFWQFFVISGGKQNDKGESIGGNMARSTLRALLESSRNIKPDDNSPEALNGRQIAGWQDFNGLTALVRLRVEKDKTGQYGPKNVIKDVITPDMKEYAQGCYEPAGPASSAPVGNVWAAPASTAPPSAPTPPPASPVPAWAR